MKLSLNLIKLLLMVYGPLLFYAICVGSSRKLVMNISFMTLILKPRLLSLKQWMLLLNLG